MSTKIFRISKDPEGFNGKWYRKESLINEIPETVNVLDYNNAIELGSMSRDAFVTMVNESSRQYGFVTSDFGEMSYLASVFGADKDWTYIFSTKLY